MQRKICALRIVLPRCAANALIILGNVSQLTVKSIIEVSIMKYIYLILLLCSGVVPQKVIAAEKKPQSCEINYLDGQLIICCPDETGNWSCKPY